MTDQPHEYFDRINVLMSSGVTEGIRPQQESLSEFARFIRYVPYPMKVGSLFLLDDGLFAAIWRNESWRLNLKFRIDGTIEYVLLDRNSTRISGDTGLLTGLHAFNELSAKYDLQILLPSPRITR